MCCLRPPDTGFFRIIPSSIYRLFLTLQKKDEYKLLNISRRFACIIKHQKKTWEHTAGARWCIGVFRVIRTGIDNNTVDMGVGSETKYDTVKQWKKGQVMQEFIAGESSEVVLSMEDGNALI